MKAFLDDSNNLALVLSGETPDELVQYSNLKDLLAVYLPALEWVDPVSIGANTYRGIFRFQETMWIEGTDDSIETLRDTGEVRLIHV